MVVCGPPGFGLTWPRTHSARGGRLVHRRPGLPGLGLLRGWARSRGPAFPSCPDGRWGTRGPAHRLCPAQSLMLAKAKECWEQEHEEREAEKRRYLAERIPALQTRGLSLSALQVSMGEGLPMGDRSAQSSVLYKWLLPHLASLVFTTPCGGVGLGCGVGSHFTGGKGGSAGRRGLLGGWC